MALPPRTALNDAVLLFHRGRLAAAAEQCARVLRKQPQSFAAAHLLGLIRASEGKIDAAAQCFERAVALDPRSFEARKNLGTALGRLERHEAAAASFEEALRLKPNDAMTHNDLAVALAQANRRDAAMTHFDAALMLDPRLVDAQNNRATTLLAMRRFEEALAGFEAALALAPDDADIHNNLGDALRRLGRGEAAVAHFERALTLAPRHAEAQNNLGVALAGLNRHERAIVSFERALALRSGFAEAHNNLGASLRQLHRLDAAVASFERAVALKPDYVEALDNLGNALRALRRYDAAVARFEQALAHDPDDAAARSLRLALMQQICDWRGIERRAAEAVEAVQARQAPLLPFFFLAASDDPGAQLLSARQFWRARQLPVAPAAAPRRPRAGDKLRLGYLSADFHDHATARLMAELFERHDRAGFELHAFSHGPDDTSAMRRRVVQAFDRFSDIAQDSDAEAARRIREHEIDILVDLKGHTEGNRLAILAARPAPVQAHYLGYPGTLGTDIVDYLIADCFVVPPEQRRNFAEKLVYLPGSYQVNDRQRAIAARVPSRAECGLPEHGFVFCCFNSSYKITPPIFDVWMRLLAALPASVLWLLADNPWAQANLCREAASRGIAPGRLVFAPRQPLPEHLARHAAADLFLDTVPVNAHTTASDALWAGLPLLTCAGASFVARVAGSLLHAVDLPELVTDGLAAYEQRALALAQQPAELAAIRRKLAAARHDAPLFDADRTRRQLEAAYRGMWEIQQRGEAPRSFAVGSDLALSATA
jgi:protein O-GlcNAc transferase